MKKIIGMVILYLLAFVIIVAAVFCGIRLYKEIKAESYINGSIDISNRFTQESFNYSSTSAVFYHDLYDDTDTYDLSSCIEQLRFAEYGNKRRLCVRNCKYGLLRHERERNQQRGYEIVGQVFEQQNDFNACDDG